ncbi:probable auxin efflux carrier component 5a [Setaria italica]|uniref:probable auxin efflux carrier component 5a n=1 Tax=Setaria italica TaxID=4555 RepID=UPI0007199C81|nr:probable auxin efflux carrier component 5a [Setaria italica]
MISWGDVYKVASALVPLYVPLLLGFCSVRRWKIFTPEQCESVNSLVAFFAIPFFTFGFTVHTDPFRANYRAIAADVISKAVIAAVIGGWVLLTGGRKNAVSWSITGFSLSTLTSSLVVGVPMAQAMYGDWAQQLVVQLSVFQAIVWITLLLFALEVRKAALGTTTQIRRAADVHTSTFPQSALVIDNVEASNAEAIGVAPTVGGGRPSIWKLVKVVLYKLGRNPNTYASVGGIMWACIANTLQISLPIIIKNSIGIMAQCGNGLAMFSMGLFMAQQDKLIPCGPSLTFLSLVLKFVLDPIAMTIGSIAVGLRGDVVRVAIIQAAVPQSITSFIFAKEYGLHPDVLSTAVIVGMLVSVPLIVLFYVGLEGL